MGTNRWGGLATATLILAGVGCNAPGNPVPVLGETQMLAGAWEGDYQSPETGRSGSIVFHLKAGTDSAWGDVVMLPAGSDPAGPGDLHPPGDPLRRLPWVITISFIRCAVGEVMGHLDPYEDPDTHQKVHTTFEGRLRGNKFEGTFESVYAPSGQRTGGTWSVTRKPSP